MTVESVFQRLEEAKPELMSNVERMRFMHEIQLDFLAAISNGEKLTTHELIRQPLQARTFIKICLHFGAGRELETFLFKLAAHLGMGMRT